ncbi:MAG: RIP metalloprotease RseP [Pseudomonadota bacterium]
MENILEILTHYVLPASILLGVLIFVHEFGHFITAKMAGVRVLKFSLGFGPKLIGKKIGETEYVLSLLPLGGYVKPLGEMPDEPVAEADKPFSLTHQSVSKRLAILSAGSLFNLFFAFLIFTCVYMIGSPMLTPMVGGTLEDSPAQHAGLQEGDVIEAVNGEKIELWDELSRMVEKSNGKDLRLLVRRGGEAFDCTLTPQLSPGRDMLGDPVTTYKIGIITSTAENARIIKRYNPAVALWKGAEDTFKWSKLTLMGFAVLIKNPVERRKDIGGPILIGKLAGDFAQVSILSFLILMAMISVNLGILNLLPIPILDGGHIFFLFIEALKGSPLSMKKIDIAQQIGLALLLLIMVLVFYNDITRFLPK